MPNVNLIIKCLDGLCVPTQPITWRFAYQQPFTHLFGDISIDVGLYVEIFEHLGHESDEFFQGHRLQGLHVVLNKDRVGFGNVLPQVAVR